jgi:hypothetical protein
MYRPPSSVSVNVKLVLVARTMDCTLPFDQLMAVLEVVEVAFLNQFEKYWPATVSAAVVVGVVVSTPTVPAVIKLTPDAGVVALGSPSPIATPLALKY